VRVFTISVALALACGPDTPAGTDGGTTGTTGTTGATGTTNITAAPTTGTNEATGTTSTSTTATTGGVTSTPTTDSGDGLGEHGPCPSGDECTFGGLCVQAEGASICGPECYEYGPGPAPGRCPSSPVQRQSICPLDHENNEVPGVCLIMCGDTTDCPDPGMVCVTCPEPFQAACNALWPFSETGPNICAWPGA